MSDSDNAWIPSLKQQLAERQITRRAFLRYSTLLGMSAGAAYLYAGKITGQPLAPPARAAEMPRGGTLKISMRCPEIASPHNYNWVFDSNIGRGVHEYLTKTGADGITRPFLFQSWEVSDDLKTWTFKCRDVKWRNGRRFTAEDVAWNLKRVLAPETGSSVVGLMLGYMLSEVDSEEKDEHEKPKKIQELWDANAIEVIDDMTLRMNLKEAQIAVPEHLFHYPLAILDPEENGVFGVGSNGTGAFDLVEYGLNEKAVLKARADWWGEGPYLDQLEYHDLGDNPASEPAAVAAGQVDGVCSGNIEQLALYRSMDHVEIYRVNTAATGVARMQVDRPEFQDARVRKAMRLATEQGEVLAKAHGNLGGIADHHHVSPQHPDYFKLPPMIRDVEAAKALLREAGHPDGIDLEITCKPDPSWELAAVETMVRQWKDADIRCKINVVPTAKFWEVWDKVPLGFTEWAHRPLGIMTLGLAYRTGVPWNESHYSNAEFDTLLTKAEGTLDVSARSEIMGQLERIMQEDGPIVQPIWRGLFGVQDKRVKGFTMHPTRFIFGEELAIET